MSTEERVSKIEGRLDYLATKEDVGDLKSLINGSALSTIKWIVGVGIGILAAQVAIWMHILSRLP